MGLDRWPALAGEQVAGPGPVGVLRDAPALAWYGSAQGYQEPHLVWPRIRPGAWPARSTRRSSSPWDAPFTRPTLWLDPCPVPSDGCATRNRRRCTATRLAPASAHRLPRTNGGACSGVRPTAGNRRPQDSPPAHAACPSRRVRPWSRSRAALRAMSRSRRAWLLSSSWAASAMTSTGATTPCRPGFAWARPTGQRAVISLGDICRAESAW